MPSVPKTPGVSKSQRWYAEVVSLLDLVKAVAEGKAPVECLEANMPVLNKLATASRSMMKIPGVVAKTKPVTMVRR